MRAHDCASDRKLRMKYDCILRRRSCTDHVARIPLDGLDAVTQPLTNGSRRVVSLPPRRRRAGVDARTPTFKNRLLADCKRRVRHTETRVRWRKVLCSCESDDADTIHGRRCNYATSGDTNSDLDSELSPVAHLDSSLHSAASLFSVLCFRFEFDEDRCLLILRLQNFTELCDPTKWQ